MTFSQVACVGAGLIGSGWCTLFAINGRQVWVQDRSEGALERSQARIRRSLDLLEKAGRLKEEPGSIMGRIKITTDLQEAIGQAEYIQESVREDLKLKKDVFRKIDAHSPPDSVIASSTSGLLMSHIQTATKRPDRCVTAHPWNPPHLMPLVEIVPGRRTSPGTVESTERFMREMGKAPVCLRKEVRGHVGNRLAAALWREAIDLVVDGVVSVEDLDKAVTTSIGMRWAVYGPFLSYHLGGGEGGIAYFMEHLGPAYSEWWRSMRARRTIDKRAASIISEQMKDYGLTKESENMALEERRDRLLLQMMNVIGEQKS